jgi:hypothetical protein
VSEAVKVKRCRSNLHAQPCWHGYCADCGEGLSYYDFDEESCRAISQGALREHDCPKTNAEKQLSL